jgi:hypothetical protein
MEETLIDSIEIEPDALPPSSGNRRARQYNRTTRPSSDRDGAYRQYEADVHDPRVAPSVHREKMHSGVSNAIMMYSPYIPSVELRNVADLPTDIGNYYARIETEETVKCLITSVLFCAVVVCIFLVAILKNPGM